MTDVLAQYCCQLACYNVSDLVQKLHYCPTFEIKLIISIFFQGGRTETEAGGSRSCCSSCKGVLISKIILNKIHKNNNEIITISKKWLCDLWTSQILFMSRLGIQIRNMKMVFDFYCTWRWVTFEKLMMKIYDFFIRLSHLV